MDPVNGRALKDMTWKLGDFDSTVSLSVCKISKCNLKRRERGGKESEKIKKRKM